jgi:hypothetical protein
MSQLRQAAESTDESDGEELGTEIVSFQIGTSEEGRPTREVVTAPTKPSWELKKLTTRHKRIVQLKLAGLERVDIARMVKCTPEYISMLLSQPLVKDYMTARQADIDADLRDLTGQAVNTLRSAMDSPDDKVALASAQTVLRANGKLGGPVEHEEKLTAEDVVAKLFSISNSNVQINLSQKE